MRLLPHQLAAVCDRWGGKLIHFSTDCVFSGKRGNYPEDDFPDAEDLIRPHQISGRSYDRPSAHSSAPPSLAGSWSTESRCSSGFSSKTTNTSPDIRARMFSGVTTNYMAKVVEGLIEDHRISPDLYQVTSQTISKFDLLCLLRDAYRLDIEITPDSDFFCDRSMKGDKFTKATGSPVPRGRNWRRNLQAMTLHYEKWK